MKISLIATDISLVGRMLEEDVFSVKGTLLLPKGTVLTSTNLYTLLRHYLNALEGTRHLFQQVQDDHVPHLEQFSQAFYPVADQMLKQDGIFRSLYVLEGSENYTYRHSPEIVTLFVHYIAMLYVGARGRLNTGEVIEVILIHKDEPMRPLDAATRSILTSVSTAISPLKK